MRKSRIVKVKHLEIGGGAPVSVQSMTKTDTTDVDATVAQIEELVRGGCEIVRIAVPDKDAAVALKEIRQRVPDVPLVADIHFHYKLALAALDAGIDKLRLNPGNIGAHERVREVTRAAQSQGVPIRIGVNGGSLEKDLLAKYGTATPEAMVESALRHIRILEDLEFYDIIVSLKASDVHRTVAAYRLLAEQVDYPFHLGVTEAGSRPRHSFTRRHRRYDSRLLSRRAAGRSARRVGHSEVARSAQTRRDGRCLSDVWTIGR